MIRCLVVVTRAVWVCLPRGRVCLVSRRSTQLVAKEMGKTLSFFSILSKIIFLKIHMIIGYNNWNPIQVVRIPSVGGVPFAFNDAATAC